MEPDNTLKRLSVMATSWVRPGSNANKMTAEIKKHFSSMAFSLYPLIYKFDFIDNLRLFMESFKYVSFVNEYILKNNA